MYVKRVKMHFKDTYQKYKDQDTIIRNAKAIYAKP
jgi:hypothetical protein